jgi:DNA-binding LytR/AlgR family response regulator
MRGAERQALVLWRLLCVCLCVLITTMNVITRYHVAAEYGLAPPIIDEASSAVTTMMAMAICAAFAFWIHWKHPPLLLAAPVGVLGVLLYSAVHVGGFFLLRSLAYAVLLQESYRFGPFTREFPYELAKDAAACVIATGILWQMLRLEDRRVAPGAPPPAFIDIRDGARLTRVAVAEILAVRSAGNYAEFILEDGRRPLRRVALAALEAEMAGLNFVRTHRSWLVNAERVTGLRPQGSGDYLVEVAGVEAPVSRRYKAALRLLRDNGAASA